LKAYDSKADYIEGEGDVAVFSRTGKVKLHAPYTKERTSDDVTLTVTRRDVRGETVIKRIILPADTIVKGAYDYIADVSEADSTSLNFVISGPYTLFICICRCAVQNGRSCAFFAGYVL